MTITALTPTDITTGDPLNVKLEISVDTVAIATSTTVQAAIIDEFRTQVLAGPNAVTWDAGESRWIASFSGTDTAQLLADPDTFTSNLSYDKVLIEVQVGTPYNFSFHLSAGASKGLIS